MLQASIQPFDIHPVIKQKLAYYHSINKVPHILFHGPSGHGKKHLMDYFIHLVYGDNNDSIQQNVMYVNCALCKGIQFVREDIHFFANTVTIHAPFKSIILMNAEQLTNDAQSALRRCIEVFSNSTRFFMIVENKFKLLDPILSRFSEIYVPEPIIHKKQTNLHRYNIDQTFHMADVRTKRLATLKKEILEAIPQLTSDQTPQYMTQFVETLYNKAYSCLDIIHLVQNGAFPTISEARAYELLLTFEKVVREFRNEQFAIMFCLTFLFVSSTVRLENISFM